MKSWNRNFLEPSGPLQACNGFALPLPLPLPLGHSRPPIGLFYLFLYPYLTQIDHWTSVYVSKIPAVFIFINQFTQQSVAPDASSNSAGHQMASTGHNQLAHRRLEVSQLFVPNFSQISPIF